MKVCIACNAASVTCVCLVCHNGLCNECIPGWIDSAMPRVTMKGLPCFVCAQPVPFDRAATKTRSGAALRALAEENETKASIRNARDYFPCPSMGCE
jgi:urocanate hydratase